MTRRITQDEQEFLDILRGKWRTGELLKYLQRGQITILGPGKGFSIPMEEIIIPRAHLAPIPPDAELQETGDGKEGDANVGPDIGIGQGPGKPGTDLGPVEGDDGEGSEGGERSAGSGRGGDVERVEVPADEAYELFAEMLELPRIQPKGDKSITKEEWKYTDIRKTGPDSLVHRRRTLKEALKRNIAEGTYVPERPRIIVERPDKRYRIPEVIKKPKNNAVIFFMMDVSGSMTSEDRKMVRYFCALFEFWLVGNFDGIEIVWIIHDGEADRVDRDTFFNTFRAGGTVVSTAHALMLKIIDEEFPPANWNIYPVYLSDGFNFGDDDDLCLELIRENNLPVVNQYTYCEVSAEREWWGATLAEGGDPNSRFSPSGSFGKMLQDNFSNDTRVACTNLKKIQDIPGALKAVFGKGN